MSTLYILTSALFLIPFFGWGIHTLRVKFVHHEELSQRLEVLTVVGVTLYVAFQLWILSTWMTSMGPLYLFTALGFMAATTALYGHTLVSLASQLFVDFVSQAEDEQLHRPQFTDVDALERVGDYEGAINECMVLGRIFPKDSFIALRIAQNFSKLGRFKEAAPWYEQGLLSVDSSDRALRIVNRVVEIYLRELDRPDDALRVLSRYVELYPDAERSDTVRNRIERIEQSRSETIPSNSDDSTVESTADRSKL